MLKKLFLLLLTVVCTVGVITSCGDKNEDKIASLTLVEGSVDTVVTEGEELDLSAISVLVT